MATPSAVTSIGSAIRPCTATLMKPLAWSPSPAAATSVSVASSMLDADATDGSSASAGLATSNVATQAHPHIERTNPMPGSLLWPGALASSPAVDKQLGPVVLASSTLHSEARRGVNRARRQVAGLHEKARLVEQEAGVASRDPGLIRPALDE